MNDEKQEAIAQLTEAGSEYRYREQLITQIFTFCLVAGGGVATYSFAQICTPATLAAAVVAPLFGALVLRMFSWYMGRLNQDRRRAGDIRRQIHEKLKWNNPHAGYAGERETEETKPIPPLQKGERVAGYFIRITHLISNGLLLLGLLFIPILFFGAPPFLCAPSG